MTYLILSLVKVIDNLIMTAKSIATYNGQKVLSSILVAISQLLFYLLIKQIVSDNTLSVIILIAISSGIGNYIAFIINDKFKKDKKYTMVLTSSNIEDVKRFCNYLFEHKIKYIANDGYTRHGDKTINIVAFSKTKNESRLIEKYLEETNTKYLKEII